MSKQFNLKDFIYKWNKNFPFDYFWRKKYNIAFNSPQHREMNLIDIKIDILEEKIIKEAVEITNKAKEDFENYKLTGNWLNEKPVTSLSDEEFKNIKL